MKMNGSAAVLMLMVTIAFSVFSIMLSGYVLSVLWGWFVVTTFGLTALTVPQALGISMITHYCTHQYIKQEKQDDPMKAMGEAATYAIGRPLGALFVGWIITKFM